jgi:cytochrome c oxidase subunit 2
LFPRDASLNGHKIDELFYLAVELTLPAFIVIVAILVYCLIRFRAREGHRAVYVTGDSPRALGMTLALVALVFVGIDVNLAYHDASAFSDLFEHPPGDDALRVRVMGEQFLWSFRYAGGDGVFDTLDDVTTTSEAHIPTGRPVIFELRSRDVIHSFCLPNMRVKQDVLPGMTTYLYTEATVPGRYEIMCAQLCGFGHYAMRGTLVVDTPEQYQQWLNERSAEFGIARDK